MKNTQVEKIERYCIRYDGNIVVRLWITQREALKLGIYRLASRIADMKDMGYQIITEYIRVQNVDGTYSRIARYMILKTPDEVIHDVKNVSV